MSHSAQPTANTHTAEYHTAQGAKRQATRDLAERSRDGRWPPALQALWRSCRAAWEAYAELDGLAHTHTHAHGLLTSREREEVDALVMPAWDNWRAIERYARPLIEQWEREQTA